MIDIKKNERLRSFLCVLYDIHAVSFSRPFARFSIRFSPIAIICEYDGRSRFAETYIYYYNASVILFYCIVYSPPASGHPPI